MRVTKADCDYINDNAFPVDDKEFDKVARRLEAAGYNRNQITIEAVKAAAESEEAANKAFQVLEYGKTLSQQAEYAYLNPNHGKNLTDYLAILFNYNFGNGGRIRKFFNQIKFSTEGILQTIGKISSVKRLDNLIAYTKQLQKKYKFSEYTTKELLHELVEIGVLPELTIAAGNTAGVRAANRARANAFLQDLARRGLAPDEIAQWQELALDYTKVYQELVVAAGAVGTNIPPVPGINYLRREYTPLGSRFIEDVVRGEGIFDAEVIAGSRTSSVLHNRQFNGFVIEPPHLPIFAEIANIAPGQLYAGVATKVNKSVDVDKFNRISINDLDHFKSLNPQVVVIDDLNKAVKKVNSSKRRIFLDDWKAAKSDMDLHKILIQTPGLPDVVGANRFFWFKNANTIPTGFPYIRLEGNFVTVAPEDLATFLATVKASDMSFRLTDKSFKGAVLEILDEVHTSYLKETAANKYQYVFDYNPDIAVVNGNRVQLSSSKYEFNYDGGYVYSQATNIDDSYYIPDNASVKDVQATNLVNGLSNVVKEVKGYKGLRVEHELVEYLQQTRKQHGYDILRISLPNGNKIVIPLAEDLMKKFDKTTTVLTMFDNPILLNEYVRKVFTTEQLEQLIDFGVLSKLPLSGSEVFNYLKAKFALPFNTMSEMVETSLPKLMENYVRDLQFVTAKSLAAIMVSTDEAVAAGWAVRRKDVVPGTPQESWVPIGDIQDIFETAQLPKEWNDVLINPRVADHLNATVQVFTDPLYNSALAYTFKGFDKVIKAAFLSNPGYYYTQTAFNFIMGTSAGMKPWDFLTGRRILEKAMTQGLESLDNTKPAFIVNGKTVTLREHVETFLRSHYNNYAPGAWENVAVKLPTDIVSWINYLFSPQIKTFTILDGDLQLKGVPKIIHDIWVYATNKSGKTAGLERFVKAIRGGFSDLADTISSDFAPLAAITNFEELSVKLSTWLGSSQPVNYNVASALGDNIFRTKRLETINELNEHINKYFIRGDSVGSLVGALEVLFPLLRYTIQTPLIILQDMVAKPYRYMAYHRGIEFNNEVESKRLDLRQAGVPQWIIDNNPFIFGSYKRSDGTTDVYYLLSERFNPISQATGFYKNLDTILYEVTGQSFIGKTEAEMRAKIKGERPLVDMFLNAAHPVLQAIFATVTKRDAFTGRPLTSEVSSFVGIAVPDDVAYVLGKLFPTLESIDRANPFNKFGTPQQRDIRDNIIDPGTLSFAGAERRARGSVRTNNANIDIAAMLLRSVGVNVRPINYEGTVQSTLADIDAAEAALVKEIKALDNRIRLATVEGTVMSEATRTRLINRINSLWTMRTQLIYDRVRVRNYLRNRGIPDLDSIRENRKMLIRLYEVLNDTTTIPNAQQQQEIIDQLAKDLYESGIYDSGITNPTTK